MADENALVSLGKRSAVQLAHRTQITTEENDFSHYSSTGREDEVRVRGYKTSSEGVDAELKGTMIVSRWLDTESMTCFSLAQATDIGAYTAGQKK